MRAELRGNEVTLDLAGTKNGAHGFTISLVVVLSGDDELYRGTPVRDVWTIVETMDARTKAQSEHAFRRRGRATRADRTGSSSPTSPRARAGRTVIRCGCRELELKIVYPHGHPRAAHAHCLNVVVLAEPQLAAGELALDLRRLDGGRRRGGANGGDAPERSTSCSRGREPGADECGEGYACQQRDAAGHVAERGLRCGHERSLLFLWSAGVAEGAMVSALPSMRKASPGFEDRGPP